MSDLITVTLVGPESTDPIVVEAPDTILGTITVTMPSLTDAVIVLEPTGPMGPAGPDPWLDPVQVLTGNGALEVNYGLGKHIELTLTANTQITIIGLPNAGRLARVTFDITNTGSFNVDSWPVGVLWQQGNEPILTPSGKDTVVLTTTDGGVSFRGYLAGINFL